MNHQDVIENVEFLQTKNNATEQSYKNNICPNIGVIDDERKTTTGVCVATNSDDVFEFNNNIH